MVFLQAIARIACRLSKMNLTDDRLDIGKLDMVWLGRGTHGTSEADCPRAVPLDSRASANSHTRELVLPGPRARPHRSAAPFSRRARVAGAARAARAHPPHQPLALPAQRQARGRLWLHRLVSPFRALRPRA